MDEESPEVRHRLPEEPHARQIVEFPPQTVPATSRRGKPLAFVGRVEYVGGDEGERIRRDLADAMREQLLHFHNEQTSSNDDAAGRELGSAER